jgi:hypothetical protein
MAGKPPAGKGNQGRGHGPAALDDQIVELAFRIGGGPGGDAPDIVEGALAEAKHIRHGDTSLGRFEIGGSRSPCHKGLRIRASGLRMGKKYFSFPEA